jgi:predicted ArsR family transcriptional regulator
MRESRAGRGDALDKLESPVRRTIVDLLANLPDEDPGMSAAQVGERLGLHVTTARFHLDQLEQHRLVVSSFRQGGVGRPRKVFAIPRRRLPRAVATDASLTELTGLLAETWQATEDGAALTPDEAGRRWSMRQAEREATDAAAPPEQARTPGAWLGKVGATVDLLQRWGYVPDLRTEDGGRTAELTLVDCPFLALAAEHTDVVCGIHRGLLRGAMEALGEPDTEVALHPFVAPRTCTARITTRARFGD